MKIFFGKFRIMYIYVERSYKFQKFNKIYQKVTKYHQITESKIFFQFDWLMDTICQLTFMTTYNFSSTLIYIKYQLETIYLCIRFELWLLLETSIIA